MKTMAPRSILYHIIFRSTKSKTQKYLATIYLLLFYFTVLFIFYICHYQISSLQVTVEGLTTPFSRWVQVFVCLCRYSYWRLVCSSYLIDTLVLNRGRYLSPLCCITLSFSREKPTQAQEVAGRISGAVVGEGLHQDCKVPIINSHLLHLHYSPFASRFPLPHF